MLNLRILFFIFPIFHIYCQGHQDEGIKSAEITDFLPEQHTVPYYALLKFQFGIRYCGGTLISRNFVLTSASCLINVTDLEIILGARNMSEGEPHRVRLDETDIKHNVLLHPKYINTWLEMENNIALVKLPYPAPLNEYINIAKLPKESDTTRYIGNNAIVYGWKYVKGFPDLLPSPSYITHVTYGVIKCEELLVVPPPDRSLCVFGTGISYEDYGGPVVVNDTVVGITTACPEFWRPDWPQGWTSVGHFIDWIKSNSDVTIED